MRFCLSSDSADARLLGTSSGAGHAARRESSEGGCGAPRRALLRCFPLVVPNRLRKRTPRCPELMAPPRLAIAVSGKDVSATRDRTVSVRTPWISSPTVPPASVRNASRARVGRDGGHNYDMPRTTRRTEKLRCQGANGIRNILSCRRLCYARSALDGLCALGLRVSRIKGPARRITLFLFCCRRA